MKIEKKYKVVEYDNKISLKEKNLIIDIMKNENAESIISKVSKRISSKFIEISINSDNLHLFSIKLNQKLIGYALIAKKPEYLIRDFSKLRVDIFLNLFLRLKFFTIIDLVFSTLGVDIFFLEKKKKDIIANSINLNLLAIHKDYQSKGIGKLFLKHLLQKKSIFTKGKYVTCETFSKKAEKFYINKCNFKILGNKIRLFRKMVILKHTIN